MSTFNGAPTNNGRIINSEKAALDTVLRQHAEDSAGLPNSPKKIIASVRQTGSSHPGPCAPT